ncbi:glycosyltransferase family 2 protein [Desulfobacula sp.]|uniref:glycosyltransferase family 2 protein n=1 Tax=Desulfobacula sp. TaxID=2593537 RepID=UPI0025C322F6|nr:glycosyltransferase family 2 protein [Desulfobacula sp.]MBC2704933.1 glycosyltransferase family 2 protein [Desulfobacula sp.]
MISVCLASYNGESFIAEQLNSILEQLSDKDELIISDDGSTDRTISIIKQFNDKRIRLFCHPEKKGVNKNFETALKQARGHVIFLADQDDIWEKEKIRIMERYLTDYDLVVSDCSIIDLNGKITFDSFYALRRSGRGIFKNIRQNTYMGCCMAFQRKILDKAIPLPANVPLHDWWIGLVAEVFGITCFCPEKLVRYRRHGKNKTPFAGQSQFNFIDQVRFRKNLVCALFRVWVGGIYERNTDKKKGSTIL